MKLAHDLPLLFDERCHVWEGAFAGGDDVLVELELLVGHGPVEYVVPTPGSAEHYELPVGGGQHGKDYLHDDLLGHERGFIAYG